MRLVSNAPQHRRAGRGDGQALGRLCVGQVGNSLLKQLSNSQLSLPAGIAPIEIEQFQELPDSHPVPQSQLAQSHLAHPITAAH